MSEPTPELYAPRSSTSQNAMKQMCSENHGWARINVSLESVGSWQLSWFGGSTFGASERSSDKVERYRKFSFYRSAPLGLGPQRGLKRHDLQESDVRHCYLAVGLVRSGLTRFFHLCYPEPRNSYRGYNLLCGSQKCAPLNASLVGYLWGKVGLRMCGDCTHESHDQLFRSTNKLEETRQAGCVAHRVL